MYFDLFGTQKICSQVMHLDIDIDQLPHVNNSKKNSVKSTENVD